MTAVLPRIAAVVVLYHPTSEVIDNIRSWAGQCECFFAVDNSEGDCSEVVSRVALLEKGVLIRNRENLGIARALNIGAEKAREAGYDFLLTMDQDSSASPGMVERMLQCACSEKIGPVGLLSPLHVTKSDHKPPKQLCQDVMTPMTSGCLLSLDAYGQAGPFRDDFFIDFVDNEYCLRLRRAGFAVIRANQAVLKHRVGDTKQYGPFVATNHPPLRRYYKTRNRFRVFSNYIGDFPAHCLFDLVRLTKEILSIIIFEGEKSDKLSMIWRGWEDFRRGRFGKYDR